MLNNVYIEFCECIKKAFFSNRQQGEQFILVIDDEFIDNTCKTLSTEKEILFQAVKKMMDIHEYTTFNHIIGILAIQVYAAFYRQKDNIASSKAYYIRLSGLLNISIEDLKKWMQEKQDKYWSIFYKWCRENDFYTYKIEPTSKAYRYVNYPLSQALLNREDLKAIRYIFYLNRLISGEDITYEDFKNILFPFSSDNYKQLTPHFYKLHRDTKNTEQINLQIYYYYLHWDGHYEVKVKVKEKNKIKKLFAGNVEYTLNLTNDLTQLEVRDKYTNCQNTIELNNADFKREIKKYYHFKRENKILFAQDPTYDLWDEVRFIPKGKTGRLLHISPPNDIIRLPNIKIIKKGKGWIIYEVTEEYYSEYYSKGEKIYTLEGGLKLSHNTWMLNAPPFLIFKKETEFWLNGVKYTTKEKTLELGEGSYTLKVPLNKAYEFCLAQPKKLTNYAPCGWNLQNTTQFPRWTPDVTANIIGLDYSQLTIDTNKENPLNQWINKHRRSMIITNKKHKNISKIQFHNS